MFCRKKTSISPALGTKLLPVIKKSFFITSFSAIASFGGFAKNVQETNAENIVFSNSHAFTNILSDDKVVPLPETGTINSLHGQVESLVPSVHLNSLINDYSSKQSALLSGLPIGCSQAELTAAIIAGNNAGTAILKLPSSCTYVVATPATATEAFPVITGNITIEGGEGTVIARDPTAVLFRIFSINSGATLTLKNLTLENGSTTGLGGGVQDNGFLALENVVLTHNNAANGGAVAVISGASATVFKSRFLFNTATSVGGGGAINFGELNVRNSYFSGNRAPINGGAINTQPGGITTVFLTSMTYNTSGSLGGALSNLGTTNVTQSIINYNTGSSGGGIATGNDNVVISKTSNTAVLNNIPDNCSPLNTINECVN